MHHVAILSSYVAQGAIGLGATRAAFPPDRFDVIAVPTVILSNQPGLPACAGAPLPSKTLRAIVAALDANGWLARLDAVFIGYMPTRTHVTVAERLISKVKTANASTRVIVDPILGDDPEGLYIPDDAAQAVRDQLVSKADIVTPNRFELAWLTGSEITDAASAAEAARSLSAPLVVATSIPALDNRICNVLVSGKQSSIETVLRSDTAPHGTGDYFAGALTAALLTGESPEQALKHATQATAGLLHKSLGMDHLRLP